MSPREADRIIRSGQPVTVRNEHYDETFTAEFVRRDRWNLYTADGGIYDRTELQVVRPVPQS